MTENREQGPDASAPQGPRTDQHPVPAYAGAPAPDGHGGSQPAYVPQGWNQPPSYGGYGGGPTGPTGPGGPPTVAEERPRRPRTMTGIVTAALIAGLVGGGAGFGGAYAVFGDNPSSSTTLTSSAASPVANAEPGTVAGAASIASPSTVDIRVTLAQGTAEGSGVVLTAEGDVLTNNHVVAGSTGAITVTLADGSTHAATVVGTSPSYDLAVLRLQDVSGLTPATLGNSADLQVGQQVVAIGSPQGLTGTVTTGIVSAFDRTVAVQGEDGSAVVYNGLQTDAPINQGNSGGPLVDLQGRVVGINSAIATGSSQSTGSIGLGFAIPVDQAKRVAQEILDSGTATKPVLGVQGNAATTDGGGAQIAAVEPGSAAAQAGLAAGDVVTKVQDARVEDFADLVARVGARSPGEQVTLTVTNGGAERTVEVTLGSTPDQAASTSSGGQTQSSPQSPFGQSPFGQSPFGGN
ncbi:S1C family serine protease [Pseudonocardia abyssalis]|uniref:Trypsin-like peptidase domain-containing protein n=1 Tax=Pseudonocardia abyssalis TaxID=2792008 RepID=A0ABS6UV42_9PSEU|nr:trypsin-like peptidase domain-containing protein [Pseudonocardia abyssalis]MBW0114986.1 trypsin-like peptidase domain-containing protein [Pseudonocardia abyssalis]MBW0136126.1 trypsin-like peptidase domain-containing protein [Pseudonocardia abyssalis]